MQDWTSKFVGYNRPSDDVELTLCYTTHFITLCTTFAVARLIRGVVYRRKNVRRTIVRDLFRDLNNCFI